MTRRSGLLAVALHDVEPQTFERCALIRDWLDDLGVDRVTLLVIPASDLHPFSDRRPELVHWLLERRAGGDAIAQHGFQHRRARRPGPARALFADWQGGRAAEFPGLGPEETHAAVEAGRRVLHRAGLSPHGFVAPAYAYTPALRSELRASFDWWAGLLRVDRARPAARSQLLPALGLGTSSPLKRFLSPAGVRLGAAMTGRTMRLDLHPADFTHPGHVRALQSVLATAVARRTAVTYDEL